jgi:hypothetical protein
MRLPQAGLPRAMEAVIDGAEARKCPACGRAFTMRKEFDGKTIRCRGCRSIFVVPVAGAPSLPQARATASQPAPLAASGDRPSVSPPPRRLQEAGEAIATKEDIFEDVGDVLDRAAAGESCPPALPTCYRVTEPEAAENPLTQFIAIVLGGTVALPIAQLILWWVMEQDPLKIAPQLPASLEWMAPAEFRE